MAIRYWVGGDGTWDLTDTTHWSASSGGAGGASVPTSADAVIFDVNSYRTDVGLTQITLTADVSIASLAMSTNASRIGSIYGDTRQITVSGSVTISGTVTSTTPSIYPLLILSGNYSNTCTGTSGGATRIKCVKGTTVYQTLTVTNSNTAIDWLEIDNSNVTLDVPSAAGVDFLVFNATSARSLNLIRSTRFRRDVTVSANASIITSSVLAYSTTSSDKIYEVNGSISDLSMNYTSQDNRVFLFKGSGTITGISSSITRPFTMKFDVSSDLKVNNWSVSGTVGKLVTVQSNADSVRAKVTKLGGGVVSTDYMQVKDMQPQPDNTWISYNSTNLGNNYQWYFDNFNKPTSSLFFGSHL